MSKFLDSIKRVREAATATEAPAGPKDPAFVIYEETGEIRPAGGPLAWWRRLVGGRVWAA